MPKYSSEKGFLGFWQGLVSHFLKRCLKLLQWKSGVGVVAMPGPKEHVRMVMDIVWTA